MEELLDCMKYIERIYLFSDHEKSVAVFTGHALFSISVICSFGR